MGQLGFFDLSRRYEGLDRKNDPLVTLAHVVPWELFRAKLLEALSSQDMRTSAAERRSAAGRKPWDEVLIFKALVVQALYNLSDEQTEYQLRDRLSFMRFLGLGLEDAVPDATTLWLYREALARAGAVEALFGAFDGYLREHGFLAMGGQIIDATIVAAPRQRNSRDDNDSIKKGETPADWDNHPAKRRQKDVEARWTKKHGRTYFGYKNHISMDQRHKLVRRYSVTDAARHDSGELEAVLDPDNTCSKVWADSAYRSAEIEENLAERGHKSCIHRRGARNHPLSARERQGNATRSRVRARVEHVFGHQATAMGGKLVRTIGLVRAKMKVGMQNLTYNMSRFVHLQSVQASSA
ncbi:MAG: IS5 family transposase [Alphaproteobacteria bacterium]|nr:IS5 family transposase [Alphaproteobacteria bacterium]